MYTHRLAEDHVAAILQREAHGDRGGAVLHQQEDHGLLGFVAHQSHTVGERREERVQSVAPLACRRSTNTETSQTAQETKKESFCVLIIPIKTYHTVLHDICRYSRLDEVNTVLLSPGDVFSTSGLLSVC